MDERGRGSLEERVERLEVRAEEQGVELRYVLRRLNRVLAKRGPASTGSRVVREEAREASPPVVEPSYAPPARQARPVSPAPPAAWDARGPEPNREASRESVRPAAVTAAVGEEDRDGGFRLPFDIGGLPSGEWWLNKVGIALLLFGVAFLFKFSWDQGWLQALLTPWVRVGVGLVIGAVLTMTGFRVAGERRGFGQVLFGGGIGVFYITGFSAFQVFDLVPYAVAFAFMVAVTALAFALSLRQDEAVLAVIGVSGGLATPFLLYDDSGSLAGLVLYASLILAGAIGIHLFKGWRSLLPISFLGFWTVLLIGYVDTVNFPDAPAVGDQRSLQAGVIFAWLALWLVPTVREVLRSRDPSRWPLPEPGIIVRAISGERVPYGGAFAHGLSFATPLVALLFTQGIWDLDKALLGWVALGLAAAHALAFAGFRRFEDGGRISYTQGLAALLLATLSLVLMLEGNALLFTLAAEAAALHLLARRLSDRVLSIEAHILFLAVGAWMATRFVVGTIEGLFAQTNPTAFFDIGTLVDFSAIALAFAASMVVAPPVARRVYRIAGHAALVALILRELLPLDNGGSHVLAAWAAYASGLHLLSRRYPAWGTVIGAHMLFAAAGVWLGTRLGDGIIVQYPAATPVFNPQGIADLFVILLAAGISVLCLRPREIPAYRFLACGAFSLWLLRELGPLPGGDGYVLLAWTIFAAALFLVSRRLDAAELLVAAHLQFAVAGVLLLTRLFDGTAAAGTIAVFNVQGLIDFAVIIIAALVSRRAVSGRLVFAYWIPAHAALLVWMWRELSMLPAGDAYVSVAWGVFGAGMLVFGLRRDHTYLIRGGIATLFLLVAKLFLWDLAWVEAIWRVLLFMGFGGLFLVLSYYLRLLWHPGAGGPTHHSS